MSDFTCEVVRDLLPLYVDGVCSGSSRDMVEAHLKDCENCRALEESIKNTDIDKFVETEKNGVLMRHAKHEKTAAWKAGAIIAGILLFPVVIVALVIAAGQLEFIALPMLLSSMSLAGSVTVIPLMSKKNRFARAVICASASILLIEFFGCLDEGFSFAQAAVPTVFGLSIPFMPFALKEIDLPEKLVQRKTASVITWDILWLFLTIVVESLPTHPNTAFREGMLVSAFLLAVVIVMIFITRLSGSGIDRFTKGVVIVIFLGLWISFFNSFAKRFSTDAWSFFKGIFNIETWSLKYIAADLILALIGTTIFFAAAYLLMNTIKKIADES